MTDVPAGAMSIQADLGISVDTGTGASTTAWLTGTAGGLRLQAARPEVLIAAAGRGTATRVSDLLVAGGVRAELHGTRGRVATLDPHRTNRVGALLLGNRHLSIDRAGWVVLARAAVARVAATSPLRATARSAPAVLLAAAATTTAVVWWRSGSPGRSRRSRPQWGP